MCAKCDRVNTAYIPTHSTEQLFEKLKEINSKDRGISHAACDWFRRSNRQYERRQKRMLAWDANENIKECGIYQKVDKPIIESIAAKRTEPCIANTAR